MPNSLPVRPYSIRHSFVAWSLIGGIEPLRLVKLCGHSSKKMIYDVYGNYTDDLEDEICDIVDYLGRDYFEVKKRPLTFHYILINESCSEKPGARKS